MLFSDFYFLMIGAMISLLGMLFHGLVGQKKYMGIINQSDQEPLTKSVSLIAWHMFTIILFGSAFTLACVAYFPNYSIAAYPIIAVNLFGTLLFIFLGLGKHKHLLKMPGAYLMGITALFAWLGIS